MNFPKDLRYTSHDEWVRVDGDVATIGISDFAQDALGELVHVELPEVGRDVALGDAFCEVESVKAVAEIYAPVSGQVVAVNEALEDNAEAINADPYGSWIVKIKLTDPSELNALMDAETYAAKVSG